MEAPESSAEAGVRAPWLGTLRTAGPLVAWGVGLACGVPVWFRSDLLDAVIRGAGVGTAVLFIWMGGVSLCARILAPEPGAGTEAPDTAPEGTVGAGGDPAPGAPQDRTGG